MSNERKKSASTRPPAPAAVELAEMIRKTTEGLFYVTETDAEILPFVGGKTDSVSRENLLVQTGRPADTPVEERSFADLFARLTAEQDWHGSAERRSARQFARLQRLLEENLRDLRVFKVGRISLDVYIVGLDEGDNLLGVRTKAVET